ncbi:MAG: translation initiation factor IF-2, partial [Nitrospirota bacterium]|nr:translation initiation factor IF-2 [Nitrospirota bacterium]
MTKMRIFELAKKLNKQSKEILDALAGIGITGKTHASGIEEDIVEKIIRALSGAGDKPSESVSGPEKTGKTPRAAISPKVKASGPVGTTKPRDTVKPATGLKKSPDEKDKVAKDRNTSVVKETEPAEALALGVDEDLKLPDKFKKDIESEKIEKFKAKPGLQRAFQSIRKVESRKWHDPRQAKKGGDRYRPAQRPEQRPASLSTMPRKKTLKLREGTTVKEFSELVGLKCAEVIKKFMGLGYMPNINQPVDMDAALLVADSFGIKLVPATIEEDIFEEEEEDVTKLVPRAPVVTIMGHVDHGKTSLLDAVRKTKVTASEAGGITQHIGAYKVNLKGNDIVFLDTPGHEAFTSMRARGAKITDIVVLVVAADDGVMPQTIEAINHAKAANVPIVVTINKIDKPNANITKVKGELSEQGIISEEWGGHNIFVEVSAKEGVGIEHLLEMILLQAEMMELKANPDRKARGTIIEAKLDRGRGPVATLLIQTGTLKIGEAILSGVYVGKVKALIDDSGKRIQKAGPSTPIEVIGFSDVPSAGDLFTVVADEKKERQLALVRLQRQKSLEASKAKKLTLDDLHAKIKEGMIRDLNIIIKGDVHGSVEALKESFENITHPDVKVRVIHTSVGGINESDVMLASASNAIIIGFNVRPEMKAAQTAEREGVDIRQYNVIYEAIKDVRKALEGLLEPTLREKILGRAEVRQLYVASRLGTIAGAYVIDGYISRACDGIRVLRDSIVVHEGKIGTLKRFKEDAKEVQTGYECGILLENFNDLKVGDIFENYI